MSYHQQSPVISYHTEGTEDHHARAQMELITRMNNMGVASLEASDHEPAREIFRRALDKATETTFFPIPNTPSATKGGEVSKSLYIYQRGEYDEGMHTFSEPLSLDPTLMSLHCATATIMFNLGQLYLRVNDNESALNSFQCALQIAQWRSASEKQGAW